MAPAGRYLTAVDRACSAPNVLAQALLRACHLSHTHAGTSIGSGPRAARVWARPLNFQRRLSEHIGAAARINHQRSAGGQPDLEAAPAHEPVAAAVRHPLDNAVMLPLQYVNQGAYMGIKFY